MTLEHWSSKLVALNACEEAVAWAMDYPTYAAAWKACKRGDWMLLLADRCNTKRERIVLAECKCARLSLKYVPTGEDRPRVAIETAERWAHGKATIAEVDAAAGAARAAAWAAGAAVNARDKTLAKCAVIVRRMIPMPRLP